MENLARKGVLALAALLSCGCEMMPHSMQPSQLWKMNRQDAWDEGTFSIADPVDPRLTAPPATNLTDGQSGTAAES